MIKAILIDVAAKTVTEVLIEKNLDAYYNALDCDVFTSFPLDEKNDVYCDDEGLYKRKDFFFIEGSHQPIRGNGLILACDDEGESVDTTALVEVVRKKVRFLTLSDVNSILANGHSF
jgi:hypothetical protein